MLRTSRLLLVAQSARMLAESAARAGLRSFAVDLFGDEDTRAATEACLTVPSEPTVMNEALLLAAAERLAPADGFSSLVYGSGIDTRPDLLERLMPGRILLGNPPDTLRLLKTPRRFFRLLDELDIAYPDTLFAPPASPGPWLVKPGGSEGGKGIHCWANQDEKTTAGGYYQRFLPGEAMSALFIANGTNSRIIGFNTLWTALRAPAQPFLFAGAVNRAALTDDQRGSVARCIARITRAAGLVGLNGIDFMPDGAGIRVLEVNPRPTASLQLYDADHPGGWLREHIAACRGGALATASPGPVRAFHVVYATTITLIPAGVSWPEGCSDRPTPGSRIEPGEPLCTVSCEAGDVHEAEAVLRARTAEVLRLAADRWR